MSIEACIFIQLYDIITSGTVPSQTSGLSHPGVCEPTDSAECKAKNAWTVDCTDGADFTCEGIDSNGESMSIYLLSQLVLLIIIYSVYLVN